MKTEDWGRAPAAKGMVLVPTTRPAEPNDTGVPETVIAAPPAVSVVLPRMTSPGGPAEAVWPATVAIAVAVIGAALTGMVLLPTTRPDRPSETGVPAMVMAGAPGARGVPPTSMPDDPAVTV